MVIYVTGFKYTILIFSSPSVLFPFLSVSPSFGLSTFMGSFYLLCWFIVYGTLVFSIWFRVIVYSWPLNNTGLNSVGPLILRHFSINMYYSATRSAVGWTHGCGWNCGYGGWTVKLYANFQLHGVGTQPLCCSRVNCISLTYHNLSLSNIIPFCIQY